MNYNLDPFFLRQLREGRCVLFVGTGISAAAGLPNWENLLRSIAASAGDSPHIHRAGLDALFAKGRLLDAAGRLRTWMGGQAFHAAMRAILKDAASRPTELHKRLRDFCFRAIVTTNFDQLIEEAFEGTLPVATHRDAALLAQYLGEDRPFLYKVHGDIDRPETIVLGGDEFAEMVWGNPVFQKSLEALLLTSPVLFAGYSHSDLDFDLLFREHVKLFGQGGARRYALMQVASDEDRVQVEVLREKAIQVLAYREHGEVPGFFAWLADRVRDSVGGFTSAPPKEPIRKSAKGLGHRRVTPAARERAVVVIPGLFGSQLSVKQAGRGEKKVWLDLLALIKAGIALLDLGRREPLIIRIRATDVLAPFYRRVVETLANRFDVLTFPYDWRADYWWVADELADFIAREVGGGGPCDLVAHGEGGLVARAFIAEYGEAWTGLKIGGEGGRLVMLGTPNHGSFTALMTLLGEQPLVQTLAKADLYHSREEVRRIFASFPSLYQTLPSPFADAAWTALFNRASFGTLDVSQPLLDAGAAFHREIGRAVDPERMVCILGDGHSTVTAVEDPTRLSEPQNWAVTLAGDGNVPHHLAMLVRDGERVPAYYASTRHGDLANDALVAEAVLDVLRSGHTERLPTVPPPRP